MIMSWQAEILCTRMSKPLWFSSPELSYSHTIVLVFLSPFGFHIPWTFQLVASCSIWLNSVPLHNFQLYKVSRPYACVCATRVSSWTSTVSFLSPSSNCTLPLLLLNTMETMATHSNQTLYFLQTNRHCNTMPFLPNNITYVSIAHVMGLEYLE